MTLTRQLEIIGRSIRCGRWKFAQYLTGNALYGLTHRRCRKCAHVKGLNIHALCFWCQFTNLAAALTCDSCGCSPFKDPAGCGCVCHAEDEA